MTTEAYRIFRVGPAGPEVLFHSFGQPDGSRSRRVPLDTELAAEQHQAWNPGVRKGDGFISGWHIAPSKADAVSYLQRFGDEPGRKLAVCRVLVSGVRPKPRARTPVSLASHMLVRSGDWARRVEKG